MSKKPCNNCKVCPRRKNMIKHTGGTLSLKQQTDLLFGAIKKKSKRRGLVCEIEWKDIHRLVRAHNICPLTGIPFDNRRGTHLPYRRSVDRKDNAVGYTKDNIWIITSAANKMKGIYPLETMLYIVRQTMEHQDSLSERVKEQNQMNFDFSGMSEDDARNLNNFMG